MDSHNGSKSLVLFVVACLWSITKASSGEPMGRPIFITGLPANSSMTKGKLRRLQMTAYVHSMRIEIDSSDMENWLTNGNGAYYAKYKTLRKNLAKVESYIKKYFSVFFFNEFIFPDHECGSGSEQIKGGKSVSDLRLTLILHQDRREEFAAKAFSCLAWSENGRPIVGAMVVNLKAVGVTPTSDYSLFQIVLHEIFHVLGFNQYYFANFPIPPEATGFNYWVKTNTLALFLLKNGTQMTPLPALKIPALTKVFQDHFQCYSVDGVLLEDLGGSGTQSSHWKKLFFADEIMNPTVDNRSKISNITLTYFRLTNWYGVVEGAHQDWSFGKGKGCDLFQVCPAITEEYCSATVASKCMPDFAGIGTCQEDLKYYPGCYVDLSSDKFCDVTFTYSTSISSSKEYFGPQSLCIESQAASAPKCLKAECSSSNILTISNADGQSASCNSSGHQIEIGGDKLVCPNISAACNSLKSRCRDDCEKDSNGICLAGGHCFCFFGEESGNKCRGYRSLLLAGVSMAIAGLITLITH